MSGGSYDYAYRRVEEIADAMDNKGETVLRRAFAKHLKLVAEAMHDIEWVDSADYGEGDEIPAVEAVLGAAQQTLSMEILKKDAMQIIEQLKAFL